MMLAILSPSKALNFENSPLRGLTCSEPEFMKEAAKLIKILKKKSPAEIAQLMGLSDKLAVLNAARYQAWSLKATEHNAKAAILAFNGDVYDGFEAEALSKAQLIWTNEHIRILSGLYGVLRPLDLLQAYRLEMGTPLLNPLGRDLYAYWRKTVTQSLNALQAETIVNLASQEYFKVVDGQRLKAAVVECAFEDFKDGKYKVISFYAKRARGWMANAMVKNRWQTVAQLQQFDAHGYAYASGVSNAKRLVFRRKTMV